MLRGLEDEFEARTREVEAIRATFEEFTKYYAQSVRTWARRDLIRAVEALEANLKARIDKEGRARREKNPHWTPPDGPGGVEITLVPSTGDHVQIRVGQEHPAWPVDSGKYTLIFPRDLFTATERLKRAISAGEYDDNLMVRVELAIYEILRVREGQGLPSP